MTGQRAEGKGQRGGRRRKGKGQSVLAATLLLLAVVLAPSLAQAQSLVILVRHAERADGGAGANTMTTAPADPLLSAAGAARAARLAQVLADAGITAIYATEFRRTQDTAKPLAAKLGVPVQSVPAKDTVGLVAKLRAGHAKDVVLVIGHSNTVPEVIKALGGPTVTIGDQEYDSLFVLVPATGALTRIRVPMALDLAFARTQFPALSEAPDAWVFLDNAGGSQILGSVVDCLRDYLLTSNVQIGASYALSELAAERLQQAQIAIAELVNAERPEEIVMGPSSTVLLQTLARALAPRLQPGDEIVVSRIDHESNIGPWIALESVGVTVRFWELNRETMSLELPDLERVMSPRTRLVVFTHVSNIFGAILPVQDIARFVHERGARVCVDGVAFAPHRAVDVRAWDVDYYVLSLYKVFGPHYAVLYGKYDRLLDLANLSHYFIPADRLPGKLQPGNPNYELCWGAAGIPDYLAELGARSGATAAASRRGQIDTAFDAIAVHEAALADRLLAFLRARRGVRVIGPEVSDAGTRVPTISFVVDGRDSRDIVTRIDPLKIGIRYGDFYSRRLIEDLGLAPSNGVVRVSMVHYNTPGEIDRLVAGLELAI